MLLLHRPRDGDRCRPKRDHVLDKEQFENVWRDKSPLAGEGTMAAPLDEEAL